VGTGVNNTGVVAKVDVYVLGALSATVNMIGQGQPYVPVPVDLTGFSHVTRIAIHDVTDLAGIGWDDFSFDVASARQPWGLNGSPPATVQAKNTYPATGPTSAEVDHHFTGNLGHVWDDNAGWQASDY
jgi:hypothetical protein